MSVSSASQESQDSQSVPWVFGHGYGANSPRTLLSKIEAIQPSGPSTVLKPGVAFVAVLKPHKNIHDDIGPSDVFWAKCPLAKPVNTIIKAFGRQVPNPVLLFQGDNLLKEDQLVSSLSMSTEKLCTIRAVYLDDVDSYRSKHRDDHKLRDDFDDPAKRVSESQPPFARPNMLPSPSHQTIGIKRAASVEYPPRKIMPAFGTTVPSPSPSRPELRDSPDVRTPLEQAWIDFVYDQRQLMRYLTTSTGSVFVESPVNDFFITQEWGDLRPDQKLYFIDRSKNHKFSNLTDRRAFWIWYYERNARSRAAGINPHATFETTHAFFEETYTAWNNLSSSLRGTYHRIVQTQGYSIRIPSLPSESPPPSPQVGTIAAGRDSARNDYHTTPSPANHAVAQPGRDSSMVSSYDEARGTSSPRQSVQLPLVDDTLPERLNVNELFEGRSTEQLEQGVAKGVEVLRSIKLKLESEPSQESEHWLTAINNIEKQVVRTKTIVGVVGATGAGKSSVINAILDEERLVPTNCMRACTAVVTEISYNYEEVKYRAEIDFISREDWLKELKMSFQDLFDGSGKVSRDSTNEDSEAGIAYAKIKAVYPLMSKENMETTTIERLMEHNNVKSLLGGSRTIEDEDPASFYKQLQRYVDSKEKVFSREKKTEAEKLKAKQMEYWPLIRVVRLYVKAPALATGAVIVDLPGVHDSNQARAAVAQGYLKQCTGLWIVAPINRAVDDKSAKTLLGDSFKRQLKMDGGYNSVTFICSKTDDISITEAQDSLGLDDEMSPLYARSEELRRKKKSLTNELEDMKNKKSDMTAALDAADEQLEVWEKLGADLEDGKTVYAPKVKKFVEDRKSSEDAKPRKRPNYAENSDDESFINDEDDDLDDTYDDQDDEGDKSDADEDRGEPLTADFVADKIAELKDTKKQGRRERSTLEESIKELRRQINEISKEQDEIDAQLMGKCIRGRNEYSRGAIQQDFASGIRELDQEIAEEEDAANFNPQVDVRDYDAVAKSLPVFCVSSRGYQKLMGRLKKDKALLTFRNVDETGIPSLQAHCKKLTEINREVASKRFLNNLSQLLNSLRLWSSSDGTAANLTDEQHKREAELLDMKLRKLDTALENAVAKICSGLSDGLQEYLYDKFPLAINAGKIEANDIQASWGAPVNRENRAQGGLYWSTYKATVRRDGLWSNNDFNNDLIRPVLQHVTPGWERVFSRCLPQTLSGFATEVHALMTAFHTDVEKRAIVHGSSLATFHMLKQQLPAYREIAKDAANSAKEFINAKQRDINRDFVPTISAAMLPVYVITTAEVGAGQYKRMKEAMQRHVEQCKHHMFNDSLNHVQELLRAMLKEAGEVMLAKLDDIFMAVKRDYVSVIVGKSCNSMQGQVLPKQQRKIRAEVLDVIDGVELAMKRVVGLEPPEEDAEPQEEDDTMNDMDEHDHSASDQDPTEHQNSQNEQRHLTERNENNTPSLVGDDSAPRFNESNGSMGTANVSFDVIGTPIDKIARTNSSKGDKENTVPTQHTPAPDDEESELFKIPEVLYDHQDLDMFNDTDWVYTRSGGP